MKKQTTPKGFVKQGNTYYLQLPLKNYQELAQMQIGLLQTLQDLSKTEYPTKNGLYWLSYIVEKSIYLENYEMLDNLLKE